MSLLLTGFKELTNGELLAVNGGCVGSIPLTASIYGTDQYGNTYEQRPGYVPGYGSPNAKVMSKNQSSMMISSSLGCTGYGNGTVTDNKMVQLIANETGKDYVFGSWDCDNFVQTVMKKYGNDITNVWGDAQTTDVQTHINKLAGKTTSKPITGWSIAMMTKSDKYSVNHCGFTYVKPDGSVNFYHNTSAAGHVIVEKYKSVADFQRDFAYKKFDYYKLNL